MKKIILLSTVLLVAVGCASTSILKVGEEVLISGTYIKSSSDLEVNPDLMDGKSWQVVETKQYGQIKIVTGEGRTPCFAKERYQPSKGDLVEVYGQVTGNDTVSVCLSNKSYIRKK